MDNDNKLVIGILVIILIAGGALFFMGGTSSLAPTGDTNTLSSTASSTPGPLDQFAQCLADKGAKFYGAFWCPHCANQKRLFGNSVHLLPYIECSESDGKTQTSICQEKKIQSYPTWIFADGTVVTGEQSLAALAQKTGCSLSSDQTAAVQAFASSSEGAASRATKTPIK